MKIRIGILGYGNLGKGVEYAIRNAADMELIGVFTRRNPSDVKTAGTSVFSVSDLENMKDSIDVLVICGGSATDLPLLSPKYAKVFNIIDSFDTHANIPVHFTKY